MYVFTNRDYFPPRAGITANASAVDIGRHAKELGKKLGKYCESDVVVTDFSAEHLPLISGEAGVARAGPIGRVFWVIGL